VAPSPPGEWTPACKCYGHVAPTADSLVPCGPGHCRFATCCVSSWHGRPEWNSRRPAPGTLAGHGAPDGSSEAGFEESSFVGVTAEGSNRICGLFGAGEVVQFSKASPKPFGLTFMVRFVLSLAQEAKPGGVLDGRCLYEGEAKLVDEQDPGR